MIPLSLFYPYIRPVAPGVTDPLLDQVIVSAAIDFCARTHVIQRVITMTSVVGQQTYTIPTPSADMQLENILSVGYNGRSLRPASPNDVNSDLALQGADIGVNKVARGHPEFFFQKLPTDQGFSLYPLPQSAVTNGMTIKAAFSPVNGATTLDDELYNNWVDPIAAGALQLLMAMPGQPFTSQMGRGYGMQFERGILEAVRLKNTGMITSELRVMPRKYLI